jgi:putative ABC transport system substrate-binding protein
VRRREIIALIGAAAWPPGALAQSSGKLPTIGFLGPTTATVATQRVAVFTERLRELGWADGKTVAIEFRWAEGKAERFGEMAKELVRLQVDVIATWGTATAIAAKRATADIPIVFTVVGDPVGIGLAASLARPGGNATGLSTQHADSAGKRLELLRELLPDLRRLAVMANVGNSGGLSEMQEIQQAARSLGLEVVASGIRRPEDIVDAIEGVRDRAHALYVASDAIFNENRERINAAALGARLATMHGFRDIVAAGGLISYAPDYLDLFRRAADYVDKVLRGTKPSDLPVEQPTKFELVINLKTARELGLEIPPTLLARADEVIE